MSRKYKRYSKEFKLEAVRLAESANKQPVTEVARELGVRGEIKRNQGVRVLETESD